QFIRGKTDARSLYDAQAATQIPYFYFSSRVLIAQNAYSYPINADSLDSIQTTYAYSPAMTYATSSQFPVWFRARPNNLPAIPMVYAGPYAP
ncbi:MAG TPA: hypothetical protein PLA50_16500, partial [Bacteroidia bacterium]|nr:hypothetical protein [Bacteroidia bacterium]